jgi:hypothetical protein
MGCQGLTTWWDAFAQCRSFNGRLAVLDTKNKMEEALGLFESSFETLDLVAVGFREDYQQVWSTCAQCYVCACMLYTAAVANVLT